MEEIKIGKFFDWIMTDGDWEKTNRISLYKKVGKVLEGMDEEQIKKLIGEVKK